MKYCHKAAVLVPDDAGSVDTSHILQESVELKLYSKYGTISQASLEKKELPISTHATNILINSMKSAAKFYMQQHQKQDTSSMINFISWIKLFILRVSDSHFIAEARCLMFMVNLLGGDALRDHNTNYSEDNGRRLFRNRSAQTKNKNFEQSNRLQSFS